MAFPQVRTVGGNLVIIYTLNAGGGYPIHGAYLARIGKDQNIWIAVAWDAKGFKFKESQPCDLDIPTEELEKIRKKNQESSSGPETI